MFKIKCIDHFVITTTNSNEILSFYKKLGFSVTTKANESELAIGDFKINVQTVGQELVPHAGVVTPGSVDICFHVEQSIVAIHEEIKNAGLSVELGPVQRAGAKGDMDSIYLRDPDGNLIELSSYEI